MDDPEHIVNNYSFIDISLILHSLNMVTVRTNLLWVAIVFIALAVPFAASVGNPPEWMQKMEEKLKELEGKEINDLDKHRRLVFQDDILLNRLEAREIIDNVLEEDDRESNRFKRQAQRRNKIHQNLWPKEIKYILDAKSSKEMHNGFIVAAKAWEENTCVNFTKIEEKDVVENVTDYLFVTDDSKGDGCLSHVGKLRGFQSLILGKGCETFAHAAHEVGHALGLYHTQNRFDRNRYIKVNWNNIKPELWDQYVRLRKEKNENYRVPYDYGSIMHYHSPIEKPTMTPFDANYNTTMGSPMISFADLLLVNKHYKCKARCDTKVACKNGGFPHPRKCNECICPGGYGGALCDQRPNDCDEGKVLNASERKQSFTAFVYNRAQNTKGRYATSPENKGVVVEMGIINGHSVLGCAKAGVEVKANDNHKLTGYRFCNHQDEDDVNDVITLQSNLSLVPIILYTMEFSTTIVNLNYHYVD